MVNKSVQCRIWWIKTLHFSGANFTFLCCRSSPGNSLLFLRLRLRQVCAGSCAAPDTGQKTRRPVSCPKQHQVKRWAQEAALSCPTRNFQNGPINMSNSLMLRSIPIHLWNVTAEPGDAGMKSYVRCLWRFTQPSDQLLMWSFIGQNISLNYMW